MAAGVGNVMLTSIFVSLPMGLASVARYYHKKVTAQFS